MPMLPELTDDDIAALSRSHLEAVVAIESSSDELSTTVPSTEGQRELSRYLSGFFEGVGAEVSLDEHANVIAQLPGRGQHADRPPLALMIHLDTARGTEPCESLERLPAWDGSRVPYPDNERLEVSVQNYPSTAQFVGHDLLHGRGRAPFGLDDKLGLAHMMTLARLLFDHPAIPHRPLLLIGRPDEEIGREEALVGLAGWLSEQGVDSGYTVDGIEPFEINVENFNGMGATVRFASRPLDAELERGEVADVELLGVNTHGATAKAEGHRGALRFAAELLGRLEGQRVVPLGFQSDAIRDCDGVLRLWLGDDADRDALDAALAEVVGPHVPRGAGWSVTAGSSREGDGAVADVLAFIRTFMASRKDEPLMCEDSEGFEGYTYPYRARAGDGHVAVDVRLRDFDRANLDARRDHLIALVGERPIEVVEHYGNMAPKLAHRRDLVDDAVEAGRDVGIETKTLPIRGGTGIDPFLDRGVFVANLGTGYFAPESEKELTSMQLLAKHALWLLALVQR